MNAPRHFIAAAELRYPVLHSFFVAARKNGWIGKFQMNDAAFVETIRQTSTVRLTLAVQELKFLLDYTAKNSWLRALMTQAFGIEVELQEDGAAREFFIHVQNSLSSNARQRLKRDQGR